MRTWTMAGPVLQKQQHQKTPKNKKQFGIIHLLLCEEFSKHHGRKDTYKFFQRKYEKIKISSKQQRTYLPITTPTFNCGLLRMSRFRTNGTTSVKCCTVYLITHKCSLLLRTTLLIDLTFPSPYHTLPYSTVACEQMGHTLLYCKHLQYNTLPTRM